MPELPEVEISCRGIAPFLLHKRVEKVNVRQPQLRWLVPATLVQLEQQIIQRVFRRGKYILLETKVGTAILHLGMTGRLHILPTTTPLKKHDHVELILAQGQCLRFNDSRRFGAFLWTVTDAIHHPLLKNLGKEPLDSEFDADYLYQQTKTSKRAIKIFIMDSHIVTGIGNIYANEALFIAGIDPRKFAQALTFKEIKKLVTVIKKVLLKAIEAGGTTFRDFQNSEGKPGYFQQSLYVYGREHLPCKKCNQFLQLLRLGQRSTVFCNTCQR